jgi:hypothetical protein
MASRLFTVDLDLGLNKAKRFIFEDFSTNPSSDLTSGRIIYFTGSGGDQNHLRLYNGTAWKTIAYTDDVPTISISLDAPDLFTVSGSPANASGTLAFEWNTAAVNTVLAGPGSGSTAAIPTFRSLVAADIPSLESTKISDFNEAVADAVGGMVTSNTESGISVSYDDSDNTLDFDVADFSITLTGDVTGSGTVTNLGNVSFEATVGNDTHTHASTTISDFREAVEDTAANLITTATHSGISVAYTDNTGGAGTLAFTNTGVTEIVAGTGITIDQATGDVTITNADKGSDQNIFKTIAVSGQDSVVADSNTDTLTIAGSTGLTVTTNAGTDTITLTNSGVTSIAGTTNEIEVSAGTGSGPYTGAITIGLPNDVTIGGTLTVTGDLDVTGAINSVSTSTINVEDNLFLLNSNVTGTPSLNAGLEVERGNSTNASLIWNETSDKWSAGIAGSEIAIARKYVTTTTGTTHTITHGLATSDVTVQCWLAGAQVDAAIVVTDANTVTVTTNSSITDLKTVVVG